ncbi:helix-turn-helix domain-containing protein [Altericista sp. CCNU0014]
MSQKKYIVDLSDGEIQELERVIRSGKHSARRLTRAHILLQVHEGKSDRLIAENLRVSLSTVERTREKFVEAVSLTEALGDRPHPPKLRKLACIIHDDFGKSSKSMPTKQSGDLPKKQSVFGGCRSICVLAIGE